MKKLLRLISVATILLAATSFMACSSDDDDDDSGARSVSARTSGSIVGVVLDNKGEPVEGATVTLGGKSTKTNYGGEFEITGVNPNDSKLIAAAKTVTTKTTETTDNSTATKPSVSHETTSTNTALNSNSSTTTNNNTVSKTGYTLTVRKDGYLPGKITGIYVTYQDTEDPEVTRANALLHGLEYDYQDILDRYAAALTNPNANNGGSVGTTATTTTTATEDTTATTTVQTGSNADRVFKDISEAISALKSMYKTGSYTEYFSDFGTTTTPLIPLDASLKGKIKLNLKTRTGTTYDEKTYTPKSNPTVHVSYNSGTFNITNGTTDVAVNSADYTWEAKVDSDGNFVFDKCLPSGVPLSITVDSFEEKITKEGATEAEAYWFSSASQVIYAQGTDTSTTKITKETSISGTTTTVTTTETDAGLTNITLGSKDANEISYLIMLFAQNDKVWVTKTNVEPTANGSLLTKNDALTFTFNKAMKKVGASSTGITNLAKDSYTATLSEDKKTVTLTPNIGYWILSGDTQNVTLTVEAEDGATTLLKSVFPVYFDNKVWVSVKDLSYDDYNDLRALSDPITLVFSKPMNEKIAVKLDNNNTAYTEKWNEADAEKGILANTELTLTPDAKVGYWDLGSNTTIVITVTKEFANSKDSYIDTFGYWKVGAADTGITVHFDNYNDVTIAKADKGFTATFAKAIKAQTESELKANLKVYNVGASYAVEDTQADTADGLADVVLALSEDGKTITVTPQNTEFAKYGYYSLVFAKDKFVAKTGEKILRKPATTKTVQTYANSKTTTPFVTTFTLGTEFKYTAVTVVDKLPETALASRAIYVDNDKYLKITFNKAVRTSELKIDSKTVTNYIDGTSVYLPLATLTDNEDVKLTGDVYSTDGQKWNLGATGATEFDTLFKVNKLSYKMVATSLYTVKKAIAEGAAATAGNDALVNKIAPAETTITFTFDQDVTKADWTAEFYDSDNVKFKNLDQTPYAATAAAAGKVVTVTLSGKDRDFNKTYYLSLKATKGTGDDVVVLYDSSKGTSSYGPLPGNANKKLDSEIIADVAIGGTSTGGTPAPVVSTQKYIKVETKTEEEVAGLDNLYVVEASNNKASKTTDVKDFAKSNASPIVLEFSEDIEAIVDANEVYLAKTSNHYIAEVKDANGNVTTAEGGWLTKENVEKTDTYAATATVAGKVLTIKPTYAFPSKSTVYPIVFNKEGKRLHLKKVTDTKTTGATFDNVKYESAELKFEGSPTKKADVATNELFGKTESADLVIENFDAANVGNGSKLYFSFKPIYSKTSSGTEYGSYTLYRKVTPIYADSALWEEVDTYSIDNTKLKAVNSGKPETVNDKVDPDNTERVHSVKAASTEAFALGGFDACIEAIAAEGEFNFSKTSEYKVVCTIDNVEIHSKPIPVKDSKVHVEFKTTSNSSLGKIDKEKTLKIANNDYTNETVWGDAKFKVAGNGFIKSVVATPGSEKSTLGTSTNKNRIGFGATIEAEADDTTGKTWTVTVKPETGSEVSVAAGDFITIKVTDAKDTSTTYTIKFVKE